MMKVYTISYENKIKQVLHDLTIQAFTVSQSPNQILGNYNYKMN